MRPETDSGRRATHAMLFGMVRRTDTAGQDVLVESAFESAFMHAPTGMALMDPTGRLLRVNDTSDPDSEQRCDQYSRKRLRPHSQKHLSLLDL